MIGVTNISNRRAITGDCRYRSSARGSPFLEILVGVIRDPQVSIVITHSVGIVEISRTSDGCKTREGVCGCAGGGIGFG